MRGKHYLRQECARVREAGLLRGKGGGGFKAGTNSLYLFFFFFSFFFPTARQSFGPRSRYLNQPLVGVQCFLLCEKDGSTVFAKIIRL